MTQMALILISVTLGAIGQVLLKLGANQLQGFSLSYKALPRNVIMIVNTPAIWIGMILFFISFLLWIKVLTKSELSYAYPMVSLGYIIVVILSLFLFNETVNLHKLIGILVIIAGVVIINK
jgi:multidrug transporter EmrE-like cation transporter